MANELNIDFINIKSKDHGYIHSYTATAALKRIEISGLPPGPDRENLVCTA